MNYTIYRVTHLDSGKTYIGKHQTLDPNDGYMGSGHRIRNAVKKHGLSAFKKEVLHVFETESEMNAKEAELVTEEFCARDDTYNLCPGGQGGWGYVKTSRVALDRLVELRKDPAFMESYSKRVSDSLIKRYSRTPKRGAAHSDDSKRKIAEANKIRQSGSLNSQFGTAWITDGVSSKKVPKTDPLPDGWRKGRK